MDWGLPKSNRFIAMAARRILCKFKHRIGNANVLPEPSRRNAFGRTGTDYNCNIFEIQNRIINFLLFFFREFYQDIVDLEKTFWSLKGLAKTGQLDLESLAPLISATVPAPALNGVFSAFDENRDGHIDFKELCCGVSAACRGPNVERSKCMCTFPISNINIPRALSRCWFSITQLPLFTFHSLL